VPADDPPLVRAAQDFQEAIGYRFDNVELLIEALTHASQGERRHGRPFSNEKLEFLGDRVLGLIIADALFHRFPRETVGHFAARFAGLVDRDSLVRIARAAGIDAVLLFSGDEGDRIFQRMASPLADACEAVIGALYLDGGLAAARAFVERHWRPLLEREHGAEKDAKSRLQEWAQGRGLARPNYRETARMGPPHLPKFTVEVTVAGFPPVTGEGASKRQAEQVAAAALLAAVEARAAKPKPPNGPAST
jgi:ribonuclease-3